MNTVLGRYIPVIFILTTALVLFNAYSSYRNFQAILQNEDWVSHTHQVISLLDQSTASLETAKNQEQTFLLTDDQSYVRGLTATNRDLQNKLQTLTGLTRDNKLQQQRIPKVKTDITNSLQLFSDTIKQKQNGTLTAVPIADEEQSVKKAEALIRDMKNTENDLLKIREKESDAGRNRMYAMIAIATLLNLLFIAATYMLIATELRRRTHLEKRKDDFISMASHELKTPITSQKVYTQVLRKELKRYKNDRLNRYIDKIDDQTSRLTELITDMLDISRIQTGKLVLNQDWFDLNELVNDTVEALQGITRKHTLQIKGTLSGEIFADRYRIYQVLVNLLTNAIKYSPKGGRILITVKKTGQQCIVSIKDEGIGIAKEHQSQIFDRLYQVHQSDKERFSGLGIGLYVASQIVKRHGGSMTVKSTKGRGATFSFTLPLKPKN